MATDDEADVLGISIDPGAEPPRPAARKRVMPPKAWLATACIVALHGALIVGGLNFFGLIRVSGLERFTRENARPTEKAAANASPPAGGKQATRPLPARKPAQRLPAPALTVAGADNQRQEAPKPVGQPTPPPASPPRILDPASAKSFLAGKGLIQKGTTFLLPSESDVAPKLKALQSSAREYYAARERLYGIQLSLERMPVLDHSIISSNTHIDLLTIEMGKYPPRRGMHGGNSVDEATWQQLKAQRDAKDTERILWKEELGHLKADQPARKLKPATDEVNRRYTAAINALTDTAEAASATIRNYEKLGRDAEVSRALKIANATLGPSGEFKDHVWKLNEFERSIGMSRRTELPKPPAAPPKEPGGKGAAGKEDKPEERRYKSAYDAEKMGKFKQATTFYQLVIKNHPNTEAARKAAARLKSLPLE